MRSAHTIEMSEDMAGSPQSIAASARTGFLSVWRRPCGCPVELRWERGLVLCARCDRVFTRRAG